MVILNNLFLLNKFSHLFVKIGDCEKRIVSMCGYAVHYILVLQKLKAKIKAAKISSGQIFAFS